MSEDVSIYLIAQTKLMDLLDRFQEVNEAREALAAREAVLNEDWKAWYHIYEREKPEVPETLSADFVEAATIEGGTATAPMLAPSEGIEDRLPIIIPNKYGSKTLAVTQILTEAGEIGISPKELSAELERRGIKASESFSGNTLFRLRKRGKVFVDSGGRYVLSSLLPKEEGT
jgi:hypothetical protein